MEIELKLKKLSIKNFKAIKDLTIEFSDNTEICGDNGIGKTSIYDAYIWLLFDKDSNNNANFSIKPIDEETGETIHKIVSEVEAIFEVAGRPISLKKEYEEKYTKKRGAATEDFTGHTTKYYWDNIPVKKYEFSDRLNDLIAEDKFMLLSNAYYFSNNLKEKDRREKLLELIEDVDILEIAADPKYADIKEDLEKNSIDELIKKHKASLSKLNKEIEDIPNRIDENFKNINKGINFQELKEEKSKAEKLLQALEEKPAGTKEQIEASDSVYKQLLAVKKQKEKEILDYTAKETEEQYKLAKELQQARNNKNEAKDKLNLLELQAKKLNDQMERTEKQIADLRIKWISVNGETIDIDTNCPTCGQHLQQEKIKEAFETYKNEKEFRLKEIEKRAGEAKKELAEQTEKASQLLIDKENIYQAFTDYEQQEKSLKETYEIRKANSQTTLPASIAELEKEEKELEKKLESIQTNTPATEDNSDLIRETKGKIMNLGASLAQEQINQIAEKRIKELNGQLKETSKLYSETEKRVFMLEELSRKRMELISADLDSHFNYIKWQLFEEQINGGIKEVCIATKNGVPYNDLNTAKKINAGIDIINAFSKHLDVKVPIFIDGGESINSIEPTDNQIIKLTVTKDKDFVIKTY